jgi:hypothetical protein
MQKRVELQRRLFGAERYIMDDIAAGVDIVSSERSEYTKSSPQAWNYAT